MPFKIPLPNRISNELFPTGSTIDLLMYDDTILDGWHVPDGMDRDLVIGVLLYTHGHAPLHHPDPEYMRKYVEIWSREQLPNWTRIYKALTAEYNPIENYDRYEDTTDTRKLDRTEQVDGSQTASRTGTSSSDTEVTGESTDTSTGTAKHDGTSTGNVSAENSNDFQPHTQTIDSTGDETKQSIDSSASSQTSTESSSADKTSGSTSQKTVGADSETYTHTNHTHGNIGVTTNQAMIREELEIRRQDTARIIADAYRNAFCLDIY